MTNLDTEHFKAWHEGRTAMVEGFHSEDNPYGLFSTNGDYWLAGFLCFPFHTFDHEHKGGVSA